MQKIKLSEFKVIPLTNTVTRLKISDEEYFGDKYKNYVSNSRLKYINPKQNGNPKIYKNGIPKEETSSLILGSAIHMLFLESDYYTLKEGYNKPSAKLGQVIEQIKKCRLQNKSIHESIIESCTKINYFKNSLSDQKIKSIIKSGFEYYNNLKNVSESDIILSNKDTELCKGCLNSLKNNQNIQKLINPTELVPNCIESYNEDTILMDVKIEYDDKSIILPLKMKADNWTIDTFQNKITLNDLKTTSKVINFFMSEQGSFFHYHYARQMAYYAMLLKNYCIKNYNTPEDVKVNCNMMVVETWGELRSKCFSVSRELLKKGYDELIRLLKMVAYYELNGYDNEVEFLD